MKRTAAVISITTLFLTFAACGGGGGGGGDQEAFCSDLQQLSDDVADGALDNTDDLRESVNALLESAPDANLEDVRDVEAALNDGDEGNDLADAIDGAFRGAARDCDIDDFAQPPETTVTTEASTTSTPSTEPSTVTTDEAPTTTTGQVATDAADVLVGGRVDVPAEIVDPAFVTLAQDCFRGLASACDDLFTQTPIGSPDEDYGRTCAGRITAEEGTTFDCVDLLFAANPVPPEVADQATAAGCQTGDMTACDNLFNNAVQGSADRTYGALCGDRVLNTDAFCVDIFGETTDL